MYIINANAIVTGAASGIGLEYVKNLLKNGAKQVAILDINEAQGGISAKNLNNEFGANKVFFIKCDVSKKEDHEEKLKMAVDKLGGLDILINNAGILNDGQWELTIDININALVRGTIFAIEFMGKDKGGKGGTVVNIGSIAGLMPIPSCPVYTASKAAVILLSRSFGDNIYFDRTGVRVMAICPGVTDTPLISEADKRQRNQEDNKTMTDILKQLQTQPPSFVAENMMKLIETGNSGEVFVCEDGKPLYKIEFPHYNTFKC